jgi:type I restriction-modification system DNA methylase subunit
MEYNLKNIRQGFKDLGVFYTQPELALYLKGLIDIPYNDVYDPTCGDGGLLSVFEDNIPKFGQEITDHQLERAKQRLANFTGYCGDTLKDPAFMDKRFSCIVANPPFSISWEPPSVGIFADPRFADVPALPPKSKADFAFILHCLHLLADDGIAVILGFPGILYRGGSEQKVRAWLVENNFIEKIIQIPPKTFIDTTISTCLLVLKKNRKETSILFQDNEIELSRLVEKDEVIANNYTLSINTYVALEEKKEVIDNIALFKSHTEATIANLQRGLEFDKLVCELENMDFQKHKQILKERINNIFDKI